MDRNRKTKHILDCFLMVTCILVVIGRNVKADFIFGDPTNLGSVINTSYSDIATNISADGLSLYLSGDRPDGYGGWDIWVANRMSKDSDWSQPINLGENINSSLDEGPAVISTDGLELYLGVVNKPGGYGAVDIWVSKRASKSEQWPPAVNLGPIVNSSSDEMPYSISSDALELYFADYYLANSRPGGYGGRDIWVVRRTKVSEPWGAPVNLGSVVNSPDYEYSPVILSSGLSLLFTSTNRLGGYGGDDIWITSRTSLSDPWNKPINLGPPINGPWVDALPLVPLSGSMLYFCSNRPGGSGREDIWQVPISPVVDFNSDGIVDSADICIMVDNWGTDEFLCDIGPTPFGDGVVDVQDLIVLAEHLFEEFPPAEPAE